MTDELNCPVCGQHFAEEEDYDEHNKENHPDVTENYPEVFDKKEDAEEQDEEDKDEADEQEDDLVWDDKNNTYVHKSEEQDEEEKEESEEEDTGADAPLKKVDSLSESWSYLSTENKASIFEGLGLTQGDAYQLANLSWNNLTKPIKSSASEAYAKEQEEEEEEKAEEQDEEDEDYKNFYNLEQNHDSKDYKTSETCENCNLVFENKEDLDAHYNDTHVPAPEFELELDKDDYKVDPLPEEEEVA